jgi:hypothetical protein
MIRKRVLLIVGLFGVLFLSGTKDCEGQVRRYQPRSPTMSPYLNLLRFNDGVLPNYFSLVRPQQQQRAFNARARSLGQQQQRQLQRVQGELQQTQILVTPTGKASWFMNPGTRQSFRNTTRYYPR